MLQTLNLYSTLYQLYINKIGKTNEDAIYLFEKRWGKRIIAYKGSLRTKPILSFIGTGKLISLTHISCL